MQYRILGGIGVFLALGSAAAWAASPMPLAHWTFDDLAPTVTDITGNGHDGTFFGDAGYDNGPMQAPIFGNVASAAFDNSGDYVSVPSAPALDIQNDLSIALWVRVTSNGAAEYLFGKDSTSFFTNYNLWIFGNKVRWVVTFADGPFPPIDDNALGSGGCDSGGCWLDTVGAFIDADHPAGTWRHVVVTYEAATATLNAWIDCELAGSVSYDTGGSLFLTPGFAVQMGQRKSSAAASSLGGNLDDVRIWDVALDPDAITGMSACDAFVETGCSDPPGDVNLDGDANAVDTQCVINAGVWSFSGSMGSMPDCLGGNIDLADLDCSGAIDVTDVQLSILYALDAALPPSLDANGNSCVDACEML